jgi:hypothetical protein
MTSAERAFFLDATLAACSTVSASPLQAAEGRLIQAGPLTVVLSA